MSQLFNMLPRLVITFLARSKRLLISWLQSPSAVISKWKVKVSQSCPTLCNCLNCSTPGFLVLHYLPEFDQIHAHWVDDVIQPSGPLLSPPPALSLSQHQGLFQWVSSSHQVAKILELQLQHQSFQWIFRIDSLGLTGLILQSKGLSRIFSTSFDI